ncbi:MAG: DUF2851 family protein [Flavobacteriales bacterium]|nr:DUF2851 family protein [Flavobacteriales bacterium]
MINEALPVGASTLQRAYEFLERPEHDVLLDPSFPYREELLQFIWEQGLFDRHGLRTVDGEMVEVVHAGTIQANSGPDLVDATVRIGGQLWAGTVEVHVRASEWYAHGHHTDPAYDNVVLHAVWVHDMDVRTSGGGRPPAVVLKDLVDPQRLTVFADLMKRKAWVPCEGQVAGVGEKVVDDQLEQVLRERLERKTAEVQALHERLGSDPLLTLHHLLLRAMGGKVNAEPFSMLAHALPIKALLKVRDDAVRTEALLFGQAGLLQVDFLDEYPRLLQQERALLARMHGLRPAPVAAWKFGRLRPSAFPSLRIAQYAQLIMQQGGSLMDLLELDDVHQLTALLNVTASAYWDTHHRFDQLSPEAPKRLGADAVEHILINAVVPLRLGLGRSLGRKHMSTSAVELLRQLPPERNVIMRGWASLGIQAGDAARSQALIELKNHACALRRCLTCGIGRDLLKRPSP